MRDVAKKIIRLLLGEYSYYFVYSLSEEYFPHIKLSSPELFRVELVDGSAIRCSVDSTIREQVGYSGPGSYSYACYKDERIVGICFYWYGDRYLKRNYWPLKNKEAKLVQIITLPEMRGQGVASTLIHLSSNDLMRKGFVRLFARIWHSNVPSLNVFKQAGWIRVARIIEIHPLKIKRPIRINLKP